MNAIEQSIRKQLESVCGGLEEQYPGLTEAFALAFFGAQTKTVPAKKPRTKKAKQASVASEEEAVVVEEAAPAPVQEAAPVESAPSAPATLPEPAPAKESSRKRVVSKKMTESFFAITTAAGKTEEEAKALFETVKKSYKDISDADLQAKGGSFESFAKSVVSGEVVAAAPVKEKKTKAKKEKAPTRIAKWTPTLTRTLTKIIEESGSIMTETIKTDFHAWVDALTDEQFAVCAMEGHMRAFLQTKILGGAGANLPHNSVAAASSAAAAPLPTEDEEELEEFEFEGETLCKGVTSGKIYRPMDTGDVWIGNAGVGRFQSV